MDFQHRQTSYRDNRFQKTLNFYALLTSSNVQEWNEIAKSFDATRRKPWKECLEFVEGKKGRAIDIACGNGRHIISMGDGIEPFGIDISSEMVKIARKNVGEAGKNAFFAVGDASALPFKSNTFDFALFIAGLHNIKGREKRITALKEIKRTLKEDGEAMISVWSRWQDRWRMHFLKKLLSLKIKNFGDVDVPWKRDVQVMRFYHLYSMRELKKDVKKAGLKIVRAWSVKKASKKHADNHFIIVKRRE